MFVRFAIPIACGALLAALAGCTKRSPELSLSGPTMGTVYSVKVADAPRGVDAAAVRTAIDEVLAEIDRGMSGYRGDSEIARFNASRSIDWFAVSPDVAAVVASALEISELSEGAFDVTVAPLVVAWGFGPEGARAAPDSGELAQISERVGFTKLHVRADPPALRKDVAELTVDLNGIAPGFAVDRLAERFIAMRIERFMIEIGGEVRARGLNSKEEPWRVAIERPVEVERSPFAIVQLEDAAVTTSGEYRNFYVRDGKRYSHTIDPRTARPIEHDLVSVVLIGSTATEADAWATALNVLGPKRGYELAQRRGLAAMFIEKEGSGWRSNVTPRFAPHLVPWSPVSLRETDS
jgi:FAD:protein FMN transferase